ncbi:hypothetical protein ACFPAG_03365 [Vogesella sp. GCM10023246]|uniref:Uncharacterized protein n=1 Tax=Vogesella oryzagri TaxID=3160864 RepID=A0ABV1M0B1_9NEIS
MNLLQRLSILAILGIVLASAVNHFLLKPQAAAQQANAASSQAQ